jgi:hypothetical protein
VVTVRRRPSTHWQPPSTAWRSWCSWGVVQPVGSMLRRFWQTSRVRVLWHLRPFWRNSVPYRATRVVHAGGWVQRSHGAGLEITAVLVSALRGTWAISAYLGAGLRGSRSWFRGISGLLEFAGEFGCFGGLGGWWSCAWCASWRSALPVSSHVGWMCSAGIAVSVLGSFVHMEPVWYSGLSCTRPCARPLYPSLPPCAWSGCGARRLVAFLLLRSGGSIGARLLGMSVGPIGRLGIFRGMPS